MKIRPVHYIAIISTVSLTGIAISAAKHLQKEDVGPPAYVESSRPAAKPAPSFDINELLEREVVSEFKKLESRAEASLSFSRSGPRIPQYSYTYSFDEVVGTSSKDGYRTFLLSRATMPLVVFEQNNNNVELTSSIININPFAPEAQKLPIYPFVDKLIARVRVKEANQQVEIKTINGWLPKQQVSFTLPLASW